MLVKKYLDETLPKALVKAKFELGDDIVILETKNVVNHPDYPGKRMIQATVGYTKEKEVKKWIPPAVDAKEKPKKGKVYPNLTKKYTEQPDQKIASADEQKPTKKKNQFDNLISDILEKKPKEFEKEKTILDEISLLRKEIGELTRKSEKPNTDETTSQFPDIYKSIQDKLLENGIQDDLAYSFINQAFLMLEGKRKAAQEEVIKHIKNEMETLLQPYNFAESIAGKKQKIILLVGPTGVGKTTIAMKLAAHPDIYGTKKVAIVSTDPYGPSEALKAFARMSGTIIHEEKDVDQIEAIKEKYKSSDVLIVDTPGKSPFAPNELEKLENFIKVLKPTDIFLVLSVGSDLKDLVLLCANYLLLKPTGIAFTKFDETTQPGKVFSILDVINLPVVCFSNGKRIFIDIAKGTPEYMYEKIFNGDIKEI